MMRRQTVRSVLSLAIALILLSMVPTYVTAQLPEARIESPRLTSVEPSPAQAGTEVEVTATGGYVIRADGSTDQSFRTFGLKLGGNTVEPLQCVNGECYAVIFVPDSLRPGRHLLEAEGSSTMALRVVKAPSEKDEPVPLVRSARLTPVSDQRDFPISAPGGTRTLKESDVVSLGRMSGLTHHFVSAAGTGGEFKLTTWTIGPEGQPIPLKHSEKIAGFDVKLVHEGLPGPFVLSAYRRSDGILWLTSWRIGDDGTLSRLATRGYKAPTFITGYGVTGRFMTSDLAEVVSSVAPLDKKPRLVTWHVDGSGNIKGKFAADPPSASRLAGQKSPIVNHQGDGAYIVNFENPQGNIVWQHWSVDAAGTPTFRADITERVDIRGANPNPLKAGTAFAALPMTPGGQSIALYGNSGLRTATMELSPVPVSGQTPTFKEPAVMSVNTLDTEAGDGIEVDLAPIIGQRFAVTDDLFESQGIGKGRLLQVEGVGVPVNQPAVGIASVTKAMTVHLGLRAVEAGLADLSDCVELTQEMFGTGDPEQTYGTSAGRVSKTEVATGQKSLPQVGDQVSLKVLMYMAMMRSDGLATKAVAYHTAVRMAEQEFGPNDPNKPATWAQYVGALYSQGYFVRKMNTRSTQLGLTDTIYCDVLGACHSTPQDQITFWREASRDPAFIEVTSKQAFTASEADAERDGCGSKTGKPFRFDAFSKSLRPAYPGYEGSKDGIHGWNLAVTYQDVDGPHGNAPFRLQCAVGKTQYENRLIKGPGACLGCFMHRNTRLGRTIWAFQQRVGIGPERFFLPNTMALMDYGYRRRFTPDRLAASEETGPPVTDLSIASVDPVQNVTANVRSDNRLEVCRWEVSTNGITRAGCRTVTYDDLGPGLTAVPGTNLEMVDVTTVGADSDYITAIRTPANQVRLELWRTGPRPL
jgi:hypothetical protein